MSDDCDWQKLHDDIQNSLRRNEEVMRDFSEWVDDQGPEMRSIRLWQSRRARPAPS
jgi:hypothetical protein